MFFTIDLKRHFYQENQIFVHLFIAILAPFLVRYKIGSEGFEIGIKLAVIYFSFIFIVHAVVHAKYYVVNKNNTLKFNLKTGEYVFEARKC